MKLSNLENKIGSALLAKAEANKTAAAKDQFDSLDVVDKQILALCNTPATDARIKEFFTARDAENKTLNIDHKIQTLMRQGFLGRGANKYVLNPEFREFITVMPMTASSDKVAEGLAEDVMLGSDISSEVMDEIRSLVLSNVDTLEVIAEEIADKHNLDEGDVYAAAQKIDRTGGKKEAEGFSEDVLGSGLPADIIYEIKDLVIANELTLEVIAESMAEKHNIDEEDVYAVAEAFDKTSSAKGAAVKKSFSLKKKTKSAASNTVTVGDVKLTTIKDADEWVVKYYENGKLNEDKTYYAGNGEGAKEDALGTMADMADSLGKQATDIGLGMGIVDRTEREEMRESLIGNKVAFDESAVEDAELFMANDSHFHSTHFEPAIKTITNFKGTEQGTDLLFYDIIKDVVEAGLKEYGRSDKWEQHDFTEQDREQLIKDMLEYIDAEYELGNLDVYKESEKLSEKEVHTAKRRLANKKAAASLGGTTSFTFNKHTLPNKAIQFTRKFLSNYRFPIAPDLNYTAVRNASTDDYNNTIDGEALVTVNFKTISGVKKSADIVVPIRGGQLLEPSTFQIDGVSYVISQSAIDNIIKSATFYNKPAVGDVFSNPLDKFTKAKLDKSKLPTYNRGMFAI
ncbi:hypothetical protein KAR91_37885 [Candidatus Pacearchaeota archaeon]|nr:hypothetical protein [Candidatus Pacearchaeota archaeon]